MYDDFNPKDIGKIGRPSKWKLQQEGWGIYDEDGKDTSAYWYGKKRPELVERNKLGHSEEVRKKISENHADVKGKKNPMFGKRHKKTSIKIMSENRKGKGRQAKSAETKAKMSLARKKYWENRRAN